MKISLLLALIASFAPASYSQSPIPASVLTAVPATANVTAKSFRSDGCTMWLDVGGYRGCCDKHDLAYFNKSGWQTRLHADNRLFTCVASLGFPYAVTAPVMWIGVRFFGSSWFPLHKKKNAAQSPTDQSLRLQAQAPHTAIGN